MSRGFLVSFFLLGLLVGCGQNGGTNPPPPPPPPPTGTFTLTGTPDKTTFVVSRGGEAKLTVSVQINNATKTAKVKLSTYIGTSGVQVSPSTITITGNGSAEFTVKDIGITEDKPYFYIYGQGLSSNNSTSGQELRRIDYQWTMQ